MQNPLQGGGEQSRNQGSARASSAESTGVENIDRRHSGSKSPSGKGPMPEGVVGNGKEASTRDDQGGVGGGGGGYFDDDDDIDFDINDLEDVLV